MLTLTAGLTYEKLRAEFQWSIPEQLNIGVACADSQPRSQLALIDIAADGTVVEYTFGELAQLSNRFANGLSSFGLEAGDRVGVVLSQGLETAIAHLAVYKLGCVAVPMSRLFGPEALRHRLGDSGARAVVIDSAVIDATVEATQGLDLAVIVVAEQVRRPHHSFWDVTDQGAAHLQPADTASDAPALLIYTSGTTGPPKGALHAHRVLFGHLPGFDLMYDFFGQVGDRVWTPADWAWIGGLFDAVLPAWHHGCSVIGTDRHGFDPEWAEHLMEDQGVRNAFLPPTALKMLRASEIRGDRLRLRSIMSGGEPLGEEMLAWGRETFGVTINEIYGQTEANIVVGNCQALWPVTPGSMGRPYPGHDVAVIDDNGSPVPVGEIGQIAVRSPDPVMFLGYWNQPAATQEKFIGDWMLTGDLGYADEDGYLWFKSRADDVILSAGYRIGPGEVEDCLLRHPKVAMAAVIGVPDDVRGQAVKAYIQIADSTSPSRDLEDDIKNFVRARLSAHEYPRTVEFVDELPLTTTGKIRRNVLREQAAKST